MKKVLDAIIVDDETPSRDELKFLLSTTACIKVSGEADSGLAAINLAAQLKPTVIFLDVQMRGMSGLETAAVLRVIPPDTLIVFASAYDEYAIKAFEVGAVDYILKPFEEQRVKTTVTRLLQYRSENWQLPVKKVDVALNTKIILAKLPLFYQGVIKLVPYSDIIYAYTDAGNVIVVTTEGQFEYGGTLAEMQTRLINTAFMRVHKSYIVNMNKVQQVIPWFKGTFWLRVEGLPNTEIPVSKGQIKEIKTVLGLK
ncbi:MAG: two component transcriptional regulator, LytTR family [Firmicutes bacterium]|nr:two component transcriptional regulator, LytTR family [Bacillota bacterium]